MDFNEARRRYQQLRADHQAGRITKEAFQSAVNALTVTDPHGNSWQLGVQSGEWYRFDGQQWVKDYPPPTPGVSAAGPPPSAQAPGSAVPVIRPPASAASTPPPAAQQVSTTPPPPPPSGGPAYPPPAGYVPQAVPVVPATKPPKKGRTCLIGCLALVGVLICLVVVGVGLVKLAPSVLSSVLPDFLPDLQGLLTSQAPVQLVNNSDKSVCYFFIRTPADDGWGADRLGDEEIIDPGESTVVWIEPDQTVDLRTLDCNEDLLHEIMQVEVTSEGITYTLEPLP